MTTPRKPSNGNVATVTLDDALAIVGEKLDAVAVLTGIELTARLVGATPIDEGTAKGNWNAAINEPDHDTDEDRRGPDAIRDASRIFQELKLSEGDTGYVSNALPYIERLNNGWSQQAPSAFVQLTVAGMRDFVEKAAEAERKRG